MSDEMTALAEQVAQVLRDKMAAQAAPLATPATFAPFQARALAAAPGLRGVLFRCSVPLPDGTEASAYLLFDADHPGGIEALAAHVAQTWPVQTYQPRPQWGNGGGGNGWNGGGYGGGYRGRRWGRRW